jgi:hypothetical protein
MLKLDQYIPASWPPILVTWVVFMIGVVILALIGSIIELLEAPESKTRQKEHERRRITSQTQGYCSHDWVHTGKWVPLAGSPNYDKVAVYRCSKCGLECEEQDLDSMSRYPGTMRW